MFPVQPLDNSIDCTRADAVCLSDMGLSFALCRARSNVKHLGGGKYRTAVAFSFWPFVACREVATLIFAILHIVRMCAEKQVGWIDTGPIGNISWRIIYVAAMTHLFVIWNRALMQLPGNAMGAGLDTQIRNLAVPGLLVWLVPQPAIIGSALVYVSPKAFFHWAVKSVSRYIADRLALYGSVALRSLSGQWSRLTAAAHAEAAWVRFCNCRQSRLAFAMTVHKADGFAFDQPPAFAAMFGNWSFLSASTKAKLGRVWLDFVLPLAPAMSKKESLGLPLNRPDLGIIGWCKACLLSAPAVAVTVWDFLRGIIDGHQNLQFWCLIRGRVSSTPPGVFVAFYSFNYTIELPLTPGEYLRIVAVSSPSRSSILTIASVPFSVKSDCP